MHAMHVCKIHSSSETWYLILVTFPLFVMSSHRSHRRKDKREPVTWGPMKFRWIEKNISPG